MGVLMATTPRKRNPGSESVESIFRRRQVAGDDVARDVLMKQYLPLARALARRYAKWSEPYEDLAQVAGLALGKAIDRFKLDRRSSFPSFAIPAILGELRHYLRDWGWSAYVSRAAEERVRAVADGVDRLTKLHGRAPAVTELATYLELSIEEVIDALDAGRAHETELLDADAAMNVLRMRFVEEMTQSQIAAQVGVSQMEISRTLSRTLERLRGALPPSP
jgi:RNA polymerase sigma-B factor